MGLLDAYSRFIYSLFTSLIRKAYKLKPSDSSDGTPEFSADKHRQIQRYGRAAERLFDLLVSVTGRHKYEHTMEVEFESCRMLIRPLIFSEVLMVSGLQEPYVKKLLKLKEGDVFVDVGAHIGTYSIPAAKRVGPSGRVIAFEPHPKSSELLESSMKLNNLNNITLIRKPVDSSRRMVSYNISGVPANSGIGADYKIQSVLQTECVDLDSALDSIQKLDWLKIDVEGNEINVLEGARNTLKKYSPKIIIEVGEDNVERAKSILESEGYRVEHLYGLYYFAVKQRAS